VITPHTSDLQTLGFVKHRCHVYKSFVRYGVHLLSIVAVMELEIFTIIVLLCWSIMLLGKLLCHVSLLNFIFLHMSVQCQRKWYTVTLKHSYG